MAHSTKRQGLTLDNVSTGYHKKVIVDGVSFSVLTEKVIVLVGADGCRKSMLLSTVTHILQPMGDSILLNSKAIHEQPTKALPCRFGILPQSSLLPEGLIIYELMSRGCFPWQNFICQRSDADEQTVEEALKLTGTQEFAYLPIEELSDGQRQRCWTAMVLAQKMPYVLPGEPTTWLDLRYQVEVLELLHDSTRHRGRTAIVVLHDLSFAVSYGDTLIFLRQGRVVCVLDEKEHCMPKLAKAVFDIDVHTSINPLTGKLFFIPFRDVERI